MISREEFTYFGMFCDKSQKLRGASRLCIVEADVQIWTNLSEDYDQVFHSQCRTVQTFSLSNIMLPYPFKPTRLLRFLLCKMRWCGDFDINVLKGEVLA